MFKKFNVKVNGVAYAVEVEEVEVKTRDTASGMRNADGQNLHINENAPQIGGDFASKYKQVYTNCHAGGNNAISGNDMEKTAPITPIMQDIGNSTGGAASFDFEAQAGDLANASHGGTAPNGGSYHESDYGGGIATAVRTITKNSVIAPIQGNISALPITIGTRVRAGEVLCAITNGGVESEILSPIDAEVVGISVKKGICVSQGDALLILAKNG